MLATVQQQFDLKNNKRSHRKICFNSTLTNHKITYDAVMKKTPPHRCPPFERSGVNASALRHPCLPLSAVTLSLNYLPRCLRSAVTCGKTLNIVTWSEHYKICCHVIITQWRPTVKHSSRKFGNLPLQAKERTGPALASAGPDWKRFYGGPHSVPWAEIFEDGIKS